VIDRFNGIGASPGGNFWVTHTETSPTVRLDDLPELPTFDLIKIDVQGAELDILKNGVRVLRSAAVVELETEFVPLYKGQPLFADVDAFMRGQGFFLHKMIDIGGRTYRPLQVKVDGDSSMPISQMVWADAIYVRDIPALLTAGSDRLFMTAALLHAVYRSYDLVAHLLQAHDEGHKTDFAARYLGKLKTDPPLRPLIANLRAGIDHVDEKLIQPKGWHREWQSCFDDVIENQGRRHVLAGLPAAGRRDVVHRRAAHVAFAEAGAAARIGRVERGRAVAGGRPAGALAPAWRRRRDRLRRPLPMNPSAGAPASEKQGFDQRLTDRRCVVERIARPEIAAVRPMALGQIGRVRENAPHVGAESVQERRESHVMDEVERVFMKRINEDNRLDTSSLEKGMDVSQRLNALRRVFETGEMIISESL
jgi:hypothetical protein